MSEASGIAGATGSISSTISANGDGNGNAQARFGTFGGVFTPCVLTILGVIMFMRTGFVVGHSGMWLAIAILGISKLITTLTAMSLSAVATNLDMRVGGVYFMISRVLGPDVGGSIGLTLFLAQAVSVAFYVIGFTEALLDLVGPSLGPGAPEWLAQVISSGVVTALFALTFRGADLAIKAQYVVLAVLLASVASFVIGGLTLFDSATFSANQAADTGSDVSFWLAFAIFFPAATGITAGANLSGDLKNPKRAIPWGTLAAIGFTAVVYLTQVVLTAGASDRADLQASPFLALQSMAVFGPLIVAGVFAATLSSALGSFLGAPRILQAMGQDRLMRPIVYFGKGAGPTNEPRRATTLTYLIAIGIIWAGDLNAVAEVISMFFLIAYGMINLSAFVESRSSNPSFRPSFRLFHWGTGMAGAVGCLVAMVKVNETYALVASAIVAAIYFYLRKQDIQAGWGDAKRGYIFQRTRDSLLYLENTHAHPKNWRPNVVAISEDPRNDLPLVRVGGWLESRRGLYTVAQVLERPSSGLEEKLQLRAAGRDALHERLQREGIVAFSEVVVVEELGAGLATFMQSYSIGGLRPNTALASYPPATDEAGRARFLQTIDVLASFDVNLAVVKPAAIDPKPRRRRIDLWWRGEKNGSLMALFAYLVRLDRMWANADLHFLRIVRSDEEAREAREILRELAIKTRIKADIDVIYDTGSAPDAIAQHSGDADLVLLGMAAASGEEAREFFRKVDPLLDRLPTTLLLWSNGEADVFA